MRKFLVVITVVLVGVIAFLGYALTSDSPTNSRPPKPVASPAASVDAGLESYYTQTLEWSDCSDGFECSVFSAPVDYANPENGDLSISVIRKFSKGKSLGSLILNPGGPGGSGIEYATYVEYVVSSTLQENFDIVGFDPRGVGASTPVECLNDKQTDVYVALDGSPDNQVEIDNAIKMSEDFAQACATKSPDLYKFVDTVSAAKDIDILRALLGDEKLNWLGKSYGTFLGAT